MASAVAPYRSSWITKPVQQRVTTAPAAAALAWDGDHARAAAARPTSTATTMITASMSATVSTGGIVTICRPTNADPPRNVYEAIIPGAGTGRARGRDRPCRENAITTAARASTDRKSVV